jgi:hypothetical protein
MTTPGKHTNENITAGREVVPTAGAPTPHHPGLTNNPDLSWEDIGIAQPTPYDLFGYPSLSWEDFEADLEAGS